MASSIVVLSGVDLQCLRRLFASGRLVSLSPSLHTQIMASNLDLCDCSHINTAKQQVLMEALRVCFRGVLSLNVLNPEKKKKKSQMGVSDWALTGWLHCLSVTYGMTSSSTYYYTKAMTDLFVNTAGESGVRFQSINTMADFWTVSSFVLMFIHFQHSQESLNHFIYYV